MMHSFVFWKKDFMVFLIYFLFFIDSYLNEISNFESLILPIVEVTSHDNRIMFTD